MVHPSDKIRYRHLFSETTRPLPLKVEVNDTTRVAIFSDSHLDLQFDFERLQKLKSMIENCDLVVINGDFWFDQNTTFEAFLTSPWSELFPLLRSKNTVYLFGNHDMPQFSDERIELFSSQAGFELDLTAGKLKFHIEHGHRLSSWSVRQVLQLFESHPMALGRLTSPFGAITNLIINTGKRRPKGLSKLANDAFKRRYQNKGEDFFVMGHTHVAEVDVVAKYINLGRTHGRDFSLLTIVGNQYSLHAT